MQFSLHFMIPFTALSLVLFSYNKYPSQVFVGDTYCYFAGMTFAVVGILAHFSKTLLLFFLPQIFNFLLSLPQLTKIINCPRHRLPKYCEKTDLRYNSFTEKFKIRNENGLDGMIVKILELFRLIKVKRSGTGPDDFIEISNLTLINVVINWVGPIHESTLTNLLMVLQVMSSGVAFFVRYKLASFVY